MPCQGWETNKAGGKGPAVARESDKSQPQPGCPTHPCVPLPLHPHSRTVPKQHRLPQAVAGTLSCCSRGMSPAITPVAKSLQCQGPCRAHRAWPRVSTCSAPLPAKPTVQPPVGHPRTCGQSSGRAERVRAGQPGRQMDGSSASIPHPFSLRQTPSDFHKSKRHTV